MDIDNFGALAPGIKDKLSNYSLSEGNEQHVHQILFIKPNLELYPFMNCLIGEKKHFAFCKTCYKVLEFNQISPITLNGNSNSNFSCTKGPTHHYHFNVIELRQIELNCCNCCFKIEIIINSPLLSLNLLESVLSNKESIRNKLDVLEELGRIFLDLIKIKEYKLEIGSERFSKLSGTDDAIFKLFKVIGFVKDDNYLIYGNKKIDTKDLVLAWTQIHMEVASMNKNEKDLNIKVISLFDDEPSIFLNILGGEYKKSSESGSANHKDLNCKTRNYYDKLGATSDMEDDLIWFSYEMLSSHQSNLTPDFLSYVLEIAAQRNSGFLFGKIDEVNLKGQFTRLEINNALKYFNLDQESKLNATNVINTFEIMVKTHPNLKSESKDYLNLLGLAFGNQTIQKYVENGYKDDTKGKIPLGLYNIGNTCYLNSLLQYYFSIKCLKENVKSFTKNKELNETSVPDSLQIDTQKVNQKELKLAKYFINQLQLLFDNLEDEASDIAAIPSKDLAKMALGNMNVVISPRPKAIKNPVIKNGVKGTSSNKHIMNAQDPNSSPILQPLGLGSGSDSGNSLFGTTVSPPSSKQLKSRSPRLNPHGNNESSPIIMENIGMNHPILVSSSSPQEIHSGLVNGSPNLDKDNDGTITSSLIPGFEREATPIIPQDNVSEGRGKGNYDNKIKKQRIKNDTLSNPKGSPSSRSSPFQHNNGNNAYVSRLEKDEDIELHHKTPSLPSPSQNMISDYSPKSLNSNNFDDNISLNQKNDLDFGSQQDVSECMDHVLWQLEKAFALKNEFLNTKESNVIKDLFYGFTRQSIKYYDDKTQKEVVSNKEEEFSHLIVNVDKEATDLYQKLDEYFAEQDVELNGNKAKRELSIFKVPPFLQIQLMRTQFDRETVQVYKCNKHLEFFDDLYLDPYLSSFSGSVVNKVKLVSLKAEKAKLKKKINRLEFLKEMEDYNIDENITMPQANEILANYLKIEAKLYEGDSDKSEKLKSSLLFKPGKKTELTSKKLNKIASVFLEKNEKLNEFIEKDYVKEYEELTKQYKELESQYFKEQYKVHAVLMHRGTADYGHYYVYIKDFKNNCWYKYNDETVLKVDKEEVFDDYSRYSGGACYLMYVHKDHINNLV